LVEGDCEVSRPDIDELDKVTSVSKYAKGRAGDYPLLRPALATRLLSLAALIVVAAPARAVTVSYTANLSTSKGNPVTHLLILETDGVHPVLASIYPSNLPGHATVVITHDAPFQPVKSLLIGVTEGMDVDGSDKTQLVMLLDPSFAAAHEGSPFSEVFPGARHSETIANLMAAVAGDAPALAWFTDTFFSGPAAGAAFDTRGAFVVAEFTSLKTIGQNATSGSWLITGFASLPKNDPRAQSGRVTGVIDETAVVDLGPFDIELLIDGNGEFAIDKSVLNDTGIAWTRFVLQLGTGVGAAFSPSTPGDGLRFDSNLNNRDESGAFPNKVVEEDRIVFSGLLPPGATAQFVFFVQTDEIHDHLVTIRQSALSADAAGAPALQPWSLALLVVLLGGVAALRLRRIHP
jgi:hypothetical protein